MPRLWNVGGHFVDAAFIRSEQAKEAGRGVAGASAEGGSGGPSGSMRAVSARVSATAAVQHWWAVGGGLRGAAQVWATKHGCPLADAHSTHLPPLSTIRTAVAPLRSLSEQAAFNLHFSCCITARRRICRRHRLALLGWISCG